jgi:ABC-2 type transport system ATP-binding protein
MIEFLSFQKSYHSNLILSIPCLRLDSGIYFLKGPNGVGKTTLLQSIAGLTVFEGKIVLNKNIDLKSTPFAFRSLVNYGVAEPIFPDFLTGEDLINIFMTGKKAKREQVDYLVSYMGLETFISQKIGEYSSGMLKKLSLLCAFLGESQWILLDEPFTTLDNQSVEDLIQWVLHYQEKFGSNFIISSHQPLPIEIQSSCKGIAIEDKTLNWVET